MTKIKICGLRREEDITYVNECKPDYIGFVFADSKRKVAKEQARELKALLSPDIQAVGVFVNEDISKVAELLREGIIDVAQLHGDETNDYILKLRKQAEGFPIIKAVRVASKDDVEKCEEIPADYLLFDSFSVKAYGGTGNTFDWELVKGVKKPFFLAGGINYENMKEALEVSGAYAVDVSSAVETDGYKDKEKIRTLIEKMRNVSKF